MRSWKWMFSYVTAASLGLWLALAVSLKFVRPAHSQTPSASAPSNGELPPEFMAETTGGEAPNQPAATPPAQPAATATPTSAPKVNPAPSPQASPQPSAPTAPAGTPTSRPEPEAVTAPAPRMSNEDYVYDPTGRRDPFKPYKTLLSGLPTRPSGNNGRPRDQAPVDPLQRWDVERFKVVGILWEVRAPKAMIKDPDGTLHTVMKNAKIGRYNGYIAAIREGEIVVIESFEIDGKMQKDTKVLELGK